MGQIFERGCFSLEVLGPQVYFPYVVDNGLLE